ncbi:MAG: triose-phosphate isomerase [Bacilli bacterium]|nr:triose-phosphate isomerase [Bacilli bacterium]
MRKKFIVGNWKMNKNIKEAEDFSRVFDEFSSGYKDIVDLGIAPSFLCLLPLKNISKNFKIIAQNVHYEEKGAYTGEISIPMLKEININMALVGHSERRMYFSENNQTCNKKNKALLLNGLIPLYCVGENLEQYNNGKSFDVIKMQIEEGLSDIPAIDVEKMVIAYEPIWSIGTGINASAEIAEKMCSFIRKTIANMYGDNVSQKIIIQYGGSVKPENVNSYLKTENIDGVLVGGASLDVNTFIDLIKKVVK